VRLAPIRPRAEHGREQYCVVCSAAHPLGRPEGRREAEAGLRGFSSAVATTCASASATTASDIA